MRGNTVTVEHLRPKPKWVRNNRTRLWVPERVGLSVAKNLRTNAGAVWQQQQMSSPSGVNADRRANFIGLTQNTAQTIDVAQTALTGEETGSGLGRASATYAQVTNTQYTLQVNPFTYTGAGTVTITRSAVFTAASAGVMVFFAAFGASATMVNNDQLVVTWTINI
jgi:hypothetical protein